MATVRFTALVEKLGKPDIYLLLTDPRKDADFRKALEEERVMSIVSPRGRAPYGVIGYEEKKRPTILVFPKPLSEHLGDKIVGIDYSLVDESEVSDLPEDKKERAGIKRKRARKVMRSYSVTLRGTATFERKEIVRAENEEEAARLAEREARDEPLSSSEKKLSVSFETESVTER